jgi:hypothetical protein
MFLWVGASGGNGRGVGLTPPPGFLAAKTGSHF